MLIDLPLPSQFNGTDYLEWRQNMINILKGQDLFDIVTRIKTAPNSGFKLTTFNRHIKIAAVLISHAVDKITNMYLESAK